jgi:hypothetical protein
VALPGDFAEIVDRQAVAPGSRLTPASADQENPRQKPRFAPRPQPSVRTLVTFELYGLRVQRMFATIRNRSMLVIIPTGSLPCVTSRR